MGRQAYITQMALGRSAFQPLPETFSDEDRVSPLVDESLPDYDSSDRRNAASENATEIPTHVAEPTIEDTPLIRSPHYVQQHNSRGHPENIASRGLARQSRRAMNDVLATVGVCVGVDADGQKRTINERSKPSFDRALIDSITTENEIGLVVDSADMILVSLANMSTIGLRQRLQTFRFYARSPMTALLRNEWQHFGAFEIVLAGAPAGLTYSALKIIRAWAIETLSVRILVRLYENVKSSGTRSKMLWLLAFVENLLCCASCAFLAPLQMYATLQRLDLLPGWPWFPHPRAFVPLSSSSPLQLPTIPTHLTLRSGVEFLPTLAMSPLFLLCLMAWTKPRISNKLRAYMRAALPKPHYPDRYSIQAASEDELDNDGVPGLCNDPNGEKSEWESKNVLEELAKDLQYIGKSITVLYDKCIRIVRKRPQNVLESGGPEHQPQPERIEIQNPDLNESARTFSVPTPSSSSSSSSSASLASPSSSLTSPRPPIEITTRTASSGTVHLNMGIPRPNPNDEPFLSNNFSTSAPPSEPDTQPNDEAKTKQIYHVQPVHRVTALSAYAADSLASHLAAHIADIILLPLEALFVRSLALAFLSSPRANPAAQAAAARLRGEVFPLGGWFGMGLRGGWRGVGDYAGKMVLVLGLEVGINMAVWQACTGFAWVSGRRWFSWGKH